MPAPKVSPEVKAQALALYEEHGAAEASRRTGVPENTISQWARRAGVTMTRAEKTRAATAQHVATLAERRARLAADLLDDAEKLRLSLWSSCKVHHWGSTSERDRNVVTTTTEFMEHEIDQPTFTDQKNILLACAIAIDKSNLLSGEATSRHETLNVDEARRRLAEEFPGVFRVVNGGAA